MLFPQLVHCFLIFLVYQKSLISSLEKVSFLFLLQQHDVCLPVCPQRLEMVSSLIRPWLMRWPTPLGFYNFSYAQRLTSCLLIPILNSLRKEKLIGLVHFRFLMGIWGGEKGEVTEGRLEIFIMNYMNSPHSICYRNIWGGGDSNGPCLIIFIINITIFIIFSIIFVVKITVNLSYFLSSKRL